MLGNRWVPQRPVRCSCSTARFGSFIRRTEGDPQDHAGTGPVVVGLAPGQDASRTSSLASEFEESVFNPSPATKCVKGTCGNAIPLFIGREAGFAPCSVPCGRGRTRRRSPTFLTSPEPFRTCRVLCRAAPSVQSADRPSPAPRLGPARWLVPPAAVPAARRPRAAASSPVRR